MINWTSTKEDADLISRVANRAIRRLPNVWADKMECYMDIAACHLNGCPLQLARMVTMPDFDFVHDVLGIREHIDRKTGRLQDCFVPRAAQPETAPA